MDYIRGQGLGALYMRKVVGALSKGTGGGWTPLGDRE